MPLPYKKGSNGPEILAWQNWAYRWAASYADIIGSKDSYFGLGEEAFVKIMQGKLGIAQTGIFGQLEASLTGFKVGSTVVNPPVAERRKIWIYTSPGSGADYWMGPSFELGEMCKNILKLNHQPVYFQKGGYLGLLGGDNKFSYNEVIWDQCKSIEWLLDNNPDAQEALQKAQEIIEIWGYESQDQLNDLDLIKLADELEFETHFSGYSQSADGVEEALEYLFGYAGRVHPGDKTMTPSTGKYLLLRHCVKLVVQFGNPSTHITGIARKIRPEWLRKKIRNVNKPNDFYAVVPNTDRIRPAFYGIIIQAEMELPFFVHVLRVAIPIIVKWAATVLPIFGPLLGSGFGPLVQVALGALNGLQGIGQNPDFGILMGMAGSEKDKEVDQAIIDILAPTGILENIPGLIQLVASLPGLQAHGMYDGNDVTTAYNHIAGFRR